MRIILAAAPFFTIPILFFIKLVTVPGAIDKETRASIPSIPSREPDGIYQFGQLVGRAIGAKRVRGAYYFDAIEDIYGFDPDREFEYRNVVLYNNMTNNPVTKDVTDTGVIYRPVLGWISRERNG